MDTSSTITTDSSMIHLEVFSVMLLLYCLLSPIAEYALAFL